MKITLLCFGKLKTPGLREAANHYLKISQISEARIEEIELKSQKTHHSSNNKEIQKKESMSFYEAIKKHRLPLETIYLLDEKASSLKTFQWVDQFKKIYYQKNHTITFCIGSSLGFSEDIYQNIPKKISLGSQTLSYELARVVLLEQLFRVLSLMKNHPYHRK